VFTTHDTSLLDKSLFRCDQIMFTGRRPPRKCVLIVCEGSKIEPAYFKGLCGKLRLHSAEARICGEECGNAPVSVVEFALQEAQQRKHDAKFQGQYTDIDFFYNTNIITNVIT